MNKLFNVAIIVSVFSVYANAYNFKCRSRKGGRLDGGAIDMSVSISPRWSWILVSTI